MADSDSGESPRRDTTVRIVKSGPLAQLSEDPVERFQHHFIHLIERNLEILDRPMLALDLACGTGVSALTIFPLLPATSRLVALSDDRIDLKLFHEQVTAKQRPFLFPRKERRDRLPFALNIFDAAWAALPRESLHPLRPILRQVLRVLRPGGQLLVAAPLRETFVELANTVGPSIQGHSSDEAFQALLKEPPQLLTASGWLDSFRRCGAIKTHLIRDTVEITIEPPLSQQPLFARYLLPVWIGDDPTLQAKALRLLDDNVHDAFASTIHVACIHARRGMTELDDAISGPSAE